MANDILPRSHKNYMGMGGYKGQATPTEVLKRSDFILSLGTSHSVSFGVRENIKHCCVNIDRNILKKKDLDIEIPIHSSLENFIPMMLKSIKNKNISSKFESWMNSCREIKALNPTITKNHRYNPINSYYLLSSLDKMSDSRHIFVNDAGSANYVSSQTLSFEKGPALR